MQKTHPVEAARVNTPARIIDANANRAREALRVMEDVARFTLNNAEISEQIKALRHDLRTAIDAMPLERGALLAARDTEGDVGTSISTPQEMARGGIRDVALAAAGRLTESLRSIEEATKTLPGNGTEVKAVESLRYRAYVAEQQIGLALGTGRARQWRLCVILSEIACIHHPWLAVAEQAIKGGADCIQLREKRLHDRDILSRLRTLVELCRPHQVSVIMNDRPDLALLGNADGVHVGQLDLPVPDVRRLVGFQLIVGVSTSNREEAKRAATDGADYVGVGPMFSSMTKEKPVVGPGHLKRFLEDPECARLPHLAISGIRPDNVDTLAALGCKGVAVCSAVCGSSDPAHACRELLATLDEFGPRPPSQEPPQEPATV
jgi:thiamine-phosphate pyrophosphorylase